MKLTGYACRHPRPPLRRAYVALGELTVLMGPNDSGKSTLLRAIQRDLAGGHFGADPEEDSEIGGVFYATVSEDELNAVIRACLTARYSSGFGEVQSAPRPPWGEGLWNLKPSRDEELAEPLTEVIKVLGHADADPARRDVLAALATSRTVALECAGRTEPAGLLAWNAYWCLPPCSELSPELVTALKGSDLEPFRSRRERGTSRVYYNKGFYRVTHGVPEHLYVDGAPIAVVALGATTEVPMPRSLAAPASFEGLQEAVIGGVTSLVNVMLRGQQDAARDDEYDAAERAERSAPRAWLMEQHGLYGLSEEAVAAAAFISSAATRLLPSFLSNRYRIDVALTDVDRWSEIAPLTLMIKANEAGSLLADFPIDDVADGFRVWLQLALLNAVEDGGRAASLLRGLAGDMYNYYMAAQQAYGDGQDPDEYEAAETAAEERFDAVARELKAFIGDAEHWVSGELEERLESVPDSQWSRIQSIDRDRWLLLVDEPERHLHPRLQRDAAKWLGSLAAQRHAPLVLATHSPAFLSLPADAATFVSVHRTPQDLRLETFSPATLDALDELCTEMGFDRGELVGLVNLWLVVEGETDKIVLDTLYRDQFADLGVEVVPMHGTAKWQALIEADALWRFTTAPVAVMFDGVGQETIDALNEADEAELTRITRDSKRSNSEKDLARLVRGLKRLGRTVHLVPNDGADVLNLLDEESIMAVFSDYPGHAEAQAAWDKHRKGTRDAFLKGRYGVEKSAESFGAIAQHMVENSKRSDGLEAALVALRLFTGASSPEPCEEVLTPE